MSALASALEKNTFILAEDKPTQKKAAESPVRKISLAIVAVIVLLGTGFGIGFWVKAATSNKAESASQSSNYINASAGECDARANIESVALAGPSKNISESMTDSAVRSHLDYVLNTAGFPYSSNVKTTFSCVDARSDDPILGTPGGDLGEFAIGVSVFFNSTGTPPDAKVIKEQFQAFLKKEISKTRPFYFHTDDSRLRLVYKNVSIALGKKISVLPTTTPPENEKEIWLRELTESYAQGCGHIRLMIQNPSNYGLTDSVVIKSVIRAFYEEWWSRSKEDKKIFDFKIKLGPLLGGAIAIVNNTGPACSDASPKVVPSAGGSTLFVYHPTAVGAFREKVLTPFFLKESNGKLKDAAPFVKGLTDLFTTQLTSTLTNLAPANAVDLFSIQVKSSKE